MSRLQEHVAKEILRPYGVRLPAGSLCASVAEVEAAATELACPVYVKAQVALGDRLAAGAVRRAADAGAAAEAAAEMLAPGGLDGRRVETLLVEQEIEASGSAYLAVDIRDDGPARFLVFARDAGSGFDPSTAPVAAAVPGNGMEPYQVRNALAEGGCRGPELLALSRLAEAALACAREWHLYTLELNPVLLTAGGPVVVDAKMETDDYATALVPDPARVADPDEDERESSARRYQRGDHRGSLRYVQLVPDAHGGTQPLVGTHSVGGGESLVVLDALAEAGIQAANYCDTSGSPSREKVAFAAGLVASQPHVSCLFFSSCIANQPLSVTASGLVDGLRTAAWDRPAVIRLAGNEESEAIEIVREWAGTVESPVEIYGRDVDEWAAAKRVAALVARDGDGLPGG